MKKVLPPNAIIIPNTATRVFQGQIFDVYQWPQQMFDGRTETFEMLRRPDTAEIIVVQGSKILLVDDEQPNRGVRTRFPGGRADEDDSWLAAGQRELREETGIVCANWRLIDVGQPVNKVEWFVATFLATNITDTLPPSVDAGGERITLRWREFAEVRANVLSGKETTMQYLVPLFNQVTSLEQLLNLGSYKGVETDR